MSWEDEMDIKIESKKVADKAKETIANVRDRTLQTLDVNGDGEVNIFDIIILGMRTPGIAIDREKFLRSEFAKKCTQEQIDKAINGTPLKAEIASDVIDKIANDVIAFERNCVSGISAALSVPGGVAMAVTIPADIIQYYGYMLRTAQKLMYLYGWEQLDIEGDNTNLDSATINTLTICLGVMYGVAGANNALKAMAHALAKGLNAKFMKTAVTKGVLYPIVKNVCKWFGFNLTKKMCTQFFSKAIPAIGGVVGGTLTFLTFKPCCDKLKTSLQNTELSNKNAEILAEEQELACEIVESDEVC